MNTSENLKSLPTVIGEMREEIENALKFCSDTGLCILEGRSIALDKVEKTSPSELPEAIDKMIKQINEESRRFYPVEDYCIFDGSRDALQEIQARFFPIKK